MKTLKLILLITLVTLSTSILKSQVSVGVGINLGTPAPAARYYYLQDIEAYYDIQASMYIYLYGGRWIHARELPRSYGHYDLNNGHRVIINDYRGNRPYDYYKEHRERFPKGRYENSPEKNSWSAKEHKAQGKQDMRQAKEHNKQDMRQAKEHNKQQNKENKGNGNRSHGNGDKGHGNGDKGHGNGDKGNGKENGHGKIN